MDKIKQFLRKHLAGRYGMDNLNNFLLGVGLVGTIISLFNLPMRVRSLISMIINIVFLVVIFRSMSRKLNTRYQENIKYLKAIKPVKAFFQVMKFRFTDRDHRYVRCPNCKNYLRTPKDIGKIKITCNHCGERFEKWV